MPKPQRPIYALRLRPLPRIDGIKALRCGLKLLLRRCSLQCLEVKIETQDDAMNITPTPEFQRAFKLVTGLECSPENLTTAINQNPDLFQQVREMHTDIVTIARQRRLITELKRRLEKQKPDIKQEEREP